MFSLRYRCKKLFISYCETDNSKKKEKKRGGGSTYPSFISVLLATTEVINLHFQNAMNVIYIYMYFHLIDMDFCKTFFLIVIYIIITLKGGHD